MASAAPFTAIVASNDESALGAMQALREAGRKMPQQVAVIGFDDMPESAYFWPPLTTVSQKLTDVGRTAVQELHRMIEARREGQAVETVAATIEPELVVRASSVRK